MNAIMPLVTTFIAVSIILGIGVTILAGTSTSIDCNTIPNASGNKIGDSLGGTGKYATETVGGATNSTALPQTGWYGTCVNISSNSQSGYALLIVTLIIIAAITILIVVRML